MTRWCYNGLAVEGPESAVLAFSIRATGPEHTFDQQPETSSILSFHQLAPLPDRVLAGPYACCPDPDTLLSILTDEPLKETVVADLDGWHAEMAMWGVKWGAMDPVIEARAEGRITYTFYTAWSPPVVLLQRLGPAYPALRFRLAFAEVHHDFRGSLELQGHRCAEHVLPPIGPNPRRRRREHADRWARREQAYFERFGSHVWDLVKPR